MALVHILILAHISYAERKGACSNASEYCEVEPTDAASGPAAPDTIDCTDVDTLLDRTNESPAHTSIIRIVVCRSARGSLLVFFCNSCTLHVPVCDYNFKLDSDADISPYV